MQDLVAFAEYILQRERCDTQLFFETPVGIIRMQAIALSEDPARAAEDSLIFVVVDPQKLSFTPRRGMPLRMSRRESSGFADVICLAAPTKLVVGLGIDLLCFVRQSSAVEKNGKVELDGKTPSVVSGRPASQVDSGEPVSSGEKAASLQDAAKNFEPRLIPDS